MRVANNNCRDFVVKRIPFKGSNLFAEKHQNYYVVYSYGYHFPIYMCDEVNARWFENSDKYSCTTSKHQSQAQPYGAITKVDTKELKRLINYLDKL